MLSLKIKKEKKNGIDIERFALQNFNIHREINSYMI